MKGERSTIVPKEDGTAFMEGVVASCEIEQASH
jgi:hypothetical protein